MAKDAKGHGSDARGTLQKLGIPLGADFHKLNSSTVQGIVDAAKAAGYRKPSNANGSTGRYFHAKLQREAARTGSGQDTLAASRLASGPKSAPAPVHDSMASLQGSIQRGHAMRSAGDGGHVSGYNEHGSRHGYNPDAVNKAIAAQNRSGRGKIGRREASAIHRLLKGR